jgi:FkbM family methyltransferase
MTIYGAFLDRALIRIDKPTRARAHWRRRLRRGDLQALLMRASVKPGDTTLDVGANWGLYTVGLSELVGPTGNVIAIEPGPALSDLRAAIARRRNVTVHEAAASDRDGEATLYVPDVRDTSAHALARLEPPAAAANKTVIVRLVRIDDLEIPRSNRLSFVKCDVEGHEDAALIGAEATIRAAMPALLVELEERHRSRPVAEAIELVTNWGYQGYVLTASGLRSLCSFDVERDQLAYLVDGRLPIPPPPGYHNEFLFLPRRSAPPVL